MGHYGRWTGDPVAAFDIVGLKLDDPMKTHSKNWEGWLLEIITSILEWLSVCKMCYLNFTFKKDSRKGNENLFVVDYLICVLRN